MKLRKILLLLAAVFFLPALASCDGQEKGGGTKRETASETKTASGTKAASRRDMPEEPYRISILQYVEHEALDKSSAGIQEALKDADWVEGEDYVLEINNAQGDQANLKVIADRFVSNGSDLIFAVATPAAQTLAVTTDSIPILGTAITDYELAKLVDSNGKPGHNVSGTSDLNPVADQVALTKELLPEMETLGVLYTSSEVNSELQAGLAKEAAEALDLKVEVATIANLNDLQQTAGSLLKGVDALYVPTDNAIASAMPLLARVANEAGVPVVSGEPGMVMKGALVTLGIDYFALGRQTGEMGILVLRGEAEPATLPIAFQTDFQLTINQDSAEALGLTLPERWKKEGVFVETKSDAAAVTDAADTAEDPSAEDTAAKEEAA